MDQILCNLITNLPGEIRAIFDHDQDITGLSSDYILSQSLFYHYPDIFLSLNLPHTLMILLNHSTYLILKKITSVTEKTSVEVFNQLFSVITSTSNNSEHQFPSYNQLESSIMNSPHFIDFSRMSRVEILIQKLILRYHLMIQPEMIIAYALKTGHSDRYHTLSLELSTDNVASLLDKTSFTNYHTRRFDYEIERRLRDYYKHLII